MAGFCVDDRPRYRPGLGSSLPLLPVLVGGALLMALAIAWAFKFAFVHNANRYRIPAEAIALCEPCCFFHPMDVDRRTELWMVRLVVRADQGTRELLLSILGALMGPGS